MSPVAVWEYKYKANPNPLTFPPSPSRHTMPPSASEQKRAKESAAPSLSPLAPSYAFLPLSLHRSNGWSRSGARLHHPGRRRRGGGGHTRLPHPGGAERRPRAHLHHPGGWSSSGGDGFACLPHPGWQRSSHVHASTTPTGGAAAASATRRSSSGVVEGLHHPCEAALAAVDLAARDPGRSSSESSVADPEGMGAGSSPAVARATAGGWIKVPRWWIEEPWRRWQRVAQI